MVIYLFSFSGKKPHTQCCLKYYIPNSEWYQIEALRFQWKKNSFQRSRIIHMFITVAMHIFSDTFSKRDDKISCDFKHSRFHCVFCNFFSVVGLRFFLEFFLINKEERLPLRAPTLLCMNWEHWIRLLWNKWNFLTFSSETVCTP